MPKIDALSDAYGVVAEKMLKETLRLKAGETLTIEAWTAGVPFANEVALRAKKIGAFPLVTYEDEKGYVRGVRSAPKDAVGKIGKHEYALVASSDAYVFIPGPPLGGYYPRITREELMSSTSYNGSWYEAAKKSGLRGARLTFGYVGNDLARLLGKRKEDIIMHQLKAATADFGKIRKRGRGLARLLKDGGEARLYTDGCELKMKLKGEPEIQDGVTDREAIAEGNNMSYVPPGYVAEDVAAGSVDGSLRISPSVTRYGLVEEAELKFRRGAFAGWSSERSPKQLRSLERVISEKERVPPFLMIGLNPLMRFGYAQDRFPEGSVTVPAGFGGVVRKGTLTIGGVTVVKEGKLVGPE